MYIDGFLVPVHKDRIEAYRAIIDPYIAAGNAIVTTAAPWITPTSRVAEKSTRSAPITTQPTKGGKNSQYCIAGSWSPPMPMSPQKRSSERY